MTYAQQIRESYGDDVETFAKRLNALPITIRSWESGNEPTGVAKLLLNYADECAISIFPRISEELASLTDEELEEIAVKTLEEDINVNNALKAILRRESELYTFAVWRRYELPTPILESVERHFDSVRGIEMFWDECRAQEEVVPFWYNYSDVAAILENYWLGIYHGKSISALFDERDNAFLRAADEHSPSSYNTVLCTLLNKWEDDVRENCKFGIYHIEKDGTVYLFTMDN